VAISIFSTRHEIASVVLLPRNDIMTQPPGEGKYNFLPSRQKKIICLFGKLQLDCPDEIINNSGFPLARE